MTPPPAPYQYIVLHQSCKNHPGVLACQAAHAAAEALIDGPAPGDTHVVALVAETSAELETLSIALSAAGLHHVLIREPDEPYFSAATAVGTRVIEARERQTFKPLFVAFKLLRSDPPLLARGGTERSVGASPTGGANQGPPSSEKEHSTASREVPSSNLGAGSNA